MIAERPKLAPHVDAMRANLAEALGVSIDRVSVKGKTNEGVGELGRGEAIAVHAIALLNPEREPVVNREPYLLMRLRFAPSPTGQLHVGNARTALFNWLLARGSGGTFVLRIEDTDVERSTRESEAAILRDLRWLGLDWDEGPDAGGPCGPYRQSERLHLYASYAQELLACRRRVLLLLLGRAARCRPSGGRRRRPSLDVRRHLPRLSLEQAQARISAGERPAIRFRVPEHRDVVFTDVVRGDVRFAGDVIGDPVIVRADGHPAYNFAVVVDDALMEITHVIRGEDHISNTPRQLLLYEAMGFTPPVFAHLALVMGPDHSPLSKRHGATSVAEFRAKGYLPEALVNYLALIGWSPRHGTASSDADELLSIDELARRFSLDGVGHSAGRVRRGEAGLGQPALPQGGRRRRASRGWRSRISSRRASR